MTLEQPTPAEIKEQETEMNTGALTSFEDFFRSLEDGQLSADCADKIRSMFQGLTNHVLEHSGKPSASLTIKFDIKLDGGSFDIKTTVTDKMPVAPRAKSSLWQTPSGYPSAVNPKQMQMFGNRRPRAVDEPAARGSVG